MRTGLVAKAGQINRGMVWCTASNDRDWSLRNIEGKDK